MKRFILLGILTLTGCGLSDTTNIFDKDNVSSGVGGNSSTSNSGAGGSENQNSSGSSCQPKTTCQSIGAECGTILNDGCGNTSDCGNNCIAPMTCGGNQNNGQFKCGCTPRTCEEQGKNCGDTDDGCGKPLSCGVCNPNKYQTTCGGTRLVDGGMLVAGVPNVCGGGCSKLPNPIANGICFSKPGHTIDWICKGNDNITQATVIPPSTDCIFSYPDLADHWCCSE